MICTFYVQISYILPNFELPDIISYITYITYVIMVCVYVLDIKFYLKIKISKEIIYTPGILFFSHVKIEK